MLCSPKHRDLSELYGVRRKKAAITTKLLDFVHRPDFYKQENTTFRKLDLFPSSGVGGGTYSTEKPKACLSTGIACPDDGQSPEA
jgi:hypothetical protein